MEWPSHVMWMWANFHASFAMILPLVSSLWPTFPTADKTPSVVSSLHAISRVFVFFCFFLAHLFYFFLAAENNRKQTTQLPGFGPTIATYIPWHSPTFVWSIAIGKAEAEAKAGLPSAASKFMFIACESILPINWAAAARETFSSSESSPPGWQTNLPTMVHLEKIY